MFFERPLSAPALQAARKAVDLVLTGHEPYPALAIDRYWNLVATNRAVPPLLAGADAVLLRPPVNVLRLSLHPAGLAPRIVICQNGARTYWNVFADRSNLPRIPRLLLL